MAVRCGYYGDGKRAGAEESAERAPAAAGGRRDNHLTRRGKPVAVITPVESGEDRISPGLRQLIAEGVIEWSGGKPRGMDNPVKLRGDGPTAAEIVIQLRD